MGGEEMPADAPLPQRQGPAAGRLTVPKDVHMLRPLPGRRDFADVIKGAEMGGDTWSLGLCGPQIISRVLERWNREAEESEADRWPHKPDSAPRCKGEGTPKKGAAPRSWERQGTVPPPGPSGRSTAQPTP